MTIRTTCQVMGFNCTNAILSAGKYTVQLSFRDYFLARADFEIEDKAL